MQAGVTVGYAALTFGFSLEVEAGNAAGQRLYRSEGFSGSERQLLSRRLS